MRKSVITLVSLSLLALTACNAQHTRSWDERIYPLDLTKASIPCNYIEQEQDRVQRRLAMAPVTKDTPRHPSNVKKTLPPMVDPALQPNAYNPALSPGEHAGAAFFGTLLGLMAAEAIRPVPDVDDKEERAAYERYGERLQAAALSQKCPATN
jgi:hypothetical protein